MSIHAKKATIAIDLAGEPLHKRGYRQEGENVQAPLKEALAAGVLLMSPWARVVEGLKAGTLEPQDCVLIDPFCGGGTLVIEGAMMAADMAPGILRDYWGFSGWRQFDPEVFARLLAEADARLEAGLARMATHRGKRYRSACYRDRSCSSRAGRLGGLHRSCGCELREHGNDA